MQLLPGEETILTSDNNIVTLTSHRILHTSKGLGTSSTTIIFLENISSIEKRHEGESMYLLAPALFLLYAAYMGTNPGNYPVPFYIPFGAVLFFLAVWWVNRERFIVIKSTGGTPVKFTIGKMAEEKVDSFIQQVMLARNQRQLKANGN